MIKLRTALPLLLTLAALSAPAADSIDLSRDKPVPADQPIPAADFFRQPAMVPPLMNLSGSHIAAIVAGTDDHLRMMVLDLASQKVEGWGGVGVEDVNRLYWLNDQRIMFGLALLKRGDVGLYAANVGGLSNYYPLLQYVGATLVAVPPTNRTSPLVWIHSHSMNSGNDGEAVNINSDITTGKVVNLLGVNTSSEDFSIIESENQRHIATRYPVLKGGMDAGFLSDNEGRLTFGYTATRDGVYHLHRLDGDHWVPSPVNLDEIEVLGAGSQPGQLLVVGPRGTGQPRPLQLLDGASGQPGEVLIADKEYDFNGYFFLDPGSHAVLGAVYERNGPKVVWFNESYAKLQEVLNGFFPGLIARIIGINEKGDRVLVNTYSDRQPAIFQWVDLANKKVSLIKNSAPWIDPKRMQPMNPIKFKTRDGKRLDAYVTMPAGATKANPPPLVVLPHAGPFTRTSWGYNAQVQFFASRGYAVLQPNYRGSAGYGWMFPKSDDWAFDKMRDDVIDATQTLARSGLVDSRRIAIVGDDFAGYLAVAAAAEEPALYRCVVSFSGVYEWTDIVRARHFYEETAAPYGSGHYSAVLDRLGDPKKEEAVFAAISPLRRADRIRAATYVGYTEFDAGEKISQAKSLESALRRNNVPCEVHSFHDEYGGLYHLRSRVEYYDGVEAFLAKNLR